MHHNVENVRDALRAAIQGMVEYYFLVVNRSKAAPSPFLRERVGVRVKERELKQHVIPAKAGIYAYQVIRLRENMHHS